MPTTIQLRNVPEELHRRLKASAANAGMSLSSYLLSESRKSPTGQRWPRCGSAYIGGRRFSPRSIPRGSFVKSAI